MTLESALSLPLTPMSAERVSRLLQSLAGYALNDHCQSACRSISVRPSLPAGPGACWPVVAVTNQRWHRFLETAFPLPLRWVEDKQDDDRRLPQTIIQCGEKLRVTLTASTDESDKKRSAKFRLWFYDPNGDWPNLSDLNFPADSAFAALALGYFSLLNNVSPAVSVWASARWDGRLLPVEELASKVDAALRWQAGFFYVAAEQTVDTLNIAQQSIVKKLAGTAGSPTVALSDYFVGGLVKPDSSDAHACFAYHAAIRNANEKLAAEYYAKVLRHHIARNCQGKIHRSANGFEKFPSVMVTIVTSNIEPVTVLIGLLGIQRVLLLYTRPSADMEKNAFADMTKKAMELQQQINDNWPECQCEIKDFIYDDNSAHFPTDFIASLRERIEEYLVGVDDSKVVFDIDRGTTMHKLGLCKLIRSDNWLATLAHRWKRNKVEHGTESLKLWRYGDDWTEPFRLDSSVSSTHAEDE